MGFRNDFIWGAATSAYQIEGAKNEDGKGESIWDRFCKKPGRIFEGQSGDIACDHYHKMKQDVKLMAELGLKAYRFSISWTRILPEGIGNVNEQGIQFYSDLIDELLSYGIVPFATLYHWDYPVSLHKKGGWLNPDSPKWFEYYTKIVAGRLGDRLKNYFTFNEPQVFIGAGYEDTIHAPGIIYPREDLLQMAHHIMLAHGLSVIKLREIVKDCKVGYAPTGDFYYPDIINEENIKAARDATFQVDPKRWSFNVSWWSDPVMLGHYPDEPKELLDIVKGFKKENDLKIMHQPLDYYGQNIYQGLAITADCSNGFQLVSPLIGHPKTAIGWPITPEAMYWVPKFLYERYKTPIIITENGMSCHDTISLDGEVHDPNRIDFLHRYLLNLKKSAEDGTDVQGYFHWSFMDNFEWANGYNERFGLVFVNFKTQERPIKDSAIWYKNMIETNGRLL